MAKINFTTDRVNTFSCEDGRQQSIYWDAKTPGLGVRVTTNGAKSYIFETRLHGKTLRTTIGSTETWTVGAAQKEATALKAKTDKGINPREELAEDLARKAETLAARETKRAADAAKAKRESVTLADVWPLYVEDRKHLWSDLHYRDNIRVMQEGGAPRKRSNELTKPGPLTSLGAVRLVDLTNDRIDAWAKVEGATRATSTRLALRLLKAFIFWCSFQADYRGIIEGNPAQSKKARETLGKPAKRNDVLQREQLAAWFGAVQQIHSPTIRAYLQILLITGGRREELASLKWDDVDFQWKSIRLADKIEDFRMVPLTPYVAQLLLELKARNDTPPRLRKMKGDEVAEEWVPSPWVFSSCASASGRLSDPSNAHRRACAIAGLELSLHGLRRSFATLSEWVEVPAGIGAQIQGHAPQGVREQNYIRRPLDLLRMWHVKIEEWMLEQAGIEFQPEQDGIRVVTAA